MAPLTTSALSKKRLEAANKKRTMKNRPPSPFRPKPSAAPLEVMHPKYPEFPLHKKKDPSGMTKPVRQLFASAKEQNLAPSVQKLFAKAKEEEMKKGGKKSRKSRKSRKSKKSKKHLKGGMADYNEVYSPVNNPITHNNNSESSIRDRRTKGVQTPTGRDLYYRRNKRPQRRYA